VINSVINSSASSGENFLQSNVKLDSRSKVLYNNEGVIGRLRGSDSYLKDLSKNQYLKILHQNIRGLKHKVNEFLFHLARDPPHVLCFTEHHLRLQELSYIRIENYLLVSNYCRKSMHKGGVSIFIYKHLPFISINLDAYCVEQDIEVSAIKVKLPYKYVCILTIGRAPVGKFRTFLTQLDQILQKLSKLKLDIIICGDFNINYLTDNTNRTQMDAMLMSYNLVKTVTFPTRFDQNSCSVIDNIFIDITKFEEYSVCPLNNRLSDHNAQIITLLNLLNMPDSYLFNYSRKINKYTNC
jgi:exonuclease III